MLWPGILLLFHSIPSSSNLNLFIFPALDEPAQHCNNYKPTLSLLSYNDSVLWLKTMSNLRADTLSVLFTGNIQQIFTHLLCNMLYVLLYTSRCSESIWEMNGIHQVVFSYSQYDNIVVLICSHSSWAAPYWLEFSCMYACATASETQCLKEKKPTYFISL